MKHHHHRYIVFWLCCFGLAASPACHADSAFRPHLSGKIVFQADHDGDWEIYAMNADGTRLAQLTNNEFDDEQPCWSPDGTQIAFVSNRDGRDEIYVMNADGTEAQRLTHQAADAKEPAWSPDGTQIVFTTYSRDQRESHLSIMNKDGTELRPIADIPGGSKQPRWSPDGKKIAFFSTQYHLGWGIQAFDVKKKQVERLTGSESSRPAWSPDNTRLAYVAERPNFPSALLTTNLADRSVQTVLASETIRPLHFAWSPDSQHLMYPQAQNDEPPNCQLMLITLSNAQVSEITNAPVQGIWPDWTRGEISEEVVKRRGVSWRLRYVYESEHSLSAAGRADADADAMNGQAMFGAAGDQPGFIAYGPYQEFPPGEYLAAFRLKLPADEASETEIVHLEVAAASSGAQLAERTLYGRDFARKNAYQTFDLAYSLTQAETLEFRVFFFAKASVWLDRITVSGTLRGDN